MTLMCQVLEVSVSGYYASRQRPVSHQKPRRCQALCRNPNDFPGESSGLWQPTYSRCLASAWHALWTQTRGAVDASAGAASQAAPAAQAQHDQQRPDGSFRAQSAQSGFHGDPSQHQVGHGYHRSPHSRWLVVPGRGPGLVLTHGCWLGDGLKRE